MNLLWPKNTRGLFASVGDNYYLCTPKKKKMKKVLFIVALLMPLTLWSQSVQERLQQIEQRRQLTRYEQMAYETGHIIDYTKYQMPSLKGTNYEAQVSVRKMVVNNDKECFLSIQFSDYRQIGYAAHIPKADVTRLLKILNEMKTMAAANTQIEADVLEKAYNTSEWVIMGYTLEKNAKVEWYLSLNGFDSGMLKFESADPLLEMLTAALAKMEQMQ